MLDTVEGTRFPNTSYNDCSNDKDYIGSGVMANENTKVVTESSIEGIVEKKDDPQKVASPRTQTGDKKPMVTSATTKPSSLSTDLKIDTSIASKEKPNSGLVSGLEKRLSALQSPTSSEVLSHYKETLLSLRSASEHSSASYGTRRSSILTSAKSLLKSPSATTEANTTVTEKTEDSNTETADLPSTPSVEEEEENSIDWGK
jgi:hypothetical protein